jgi:hypothetical protein
MSFQIKICLDNDEWDEFVVHSPQANIFCQTRFLEENEQQTHPTRRYLNIFLFEKTYITKSILSLVQLSTYIMK